MNTSEVWCRARGRVFVELTPRQDLLVSPDRDELTADELRWLDEVVMREARDECLGRMQAARGQQEAKRKAEAAIRARGRRKRLEVKASKADPKLVEALYVLPPGHGPFSPRPTTSVPKRDETHDEQMRKHCRQAANMQMFMADEPTWSPPPSAPDR